MINRRAFLSASAAMLVVPGTGIAQVPSSRRGRSTKGVLLMNRIAPSASDLYIANADGSGERKLLRDPVYEYNASFSADGRRVVFTSERNGDGNSDVFRCRIDGTGIEPLVTGPSVEDAAVPSPDGSKLAFVSTRNGYHGNIWVMDMRGRWRCPRHTRDRRRRRSAKARSRGL